jgi:hypothetical protein
MLADAVRRQVSYSIREREILHRQRPISSAIEELEALKPTSARDVANIITPILNDHDWVELLGRRWLDQILNDESPCAPIAGPPGDNGNHPIRHGVVLKNDYVQIAIQAFDAQVINRLRSEHDPSIVELSGRSTMIKVINDGSLTADLFEFDGINENSDVEETRFPIGCRRITLSRDSGILEYSGYSTALSILSATNDPLILIANIIPDSLSFRCAYNVLDGSLYSVSASDERDNLSRMLMVALRLLEDESRGSALKEFLDHSCYFVRWNSIRELVIDQGASFIDELEIISDHETNPCVRRGAHSIIHYLQQ